MVGTLNNSVPARDISYGVVQSFRKRIVLADNTIARTVGVVPAGSIILKPLSGVVVHVVGNAGTANVLDIGYVRASGTDDDYFGTDLSLLALNFVPLDETVTGYYVSEDTTITATLGLTGTAATTGDFEVIITFITGGR